MKIFSLVLSVLCFTILHAQQVTKVLVSGYGGTYVSHDLSVEESFKRGYASYDGSEFQGIITQYVDKSSYMTSSFSYASGNGYEVIVRSYKGVYSASTTAASYSDIKAFMPAGSNNYTNIFTGDIQSSPIVVTGAGDDSCETGYSIEFFSPDPLTIEPDYSSFSNGYVAGQICFIANKLDCSVEQARQVCRMHASQYGNFDTHNGYGEIDVSLVLANSVLPVELSSFSASSVENGIKLEWNTATELNNYGFEIERKTLGSELGGEGSSEFRVLSSELGGEGYEKIGFVAGAGNSNSLKSYSFVDRVNVSGKYSYRLKQVDNDGTYKYSDVIGINYSAKQPEKFELSQNYPNPFNPSTNIRYQISEAAYVTLKVYDILGREVATLVNEFQNAGSYTSEFKTQNSELRTQNSSGVYIAQLKAGKYSRSIKMNLVK